MIYALEHPYVVSLIVASMAMTYHIKANTGRSGAIEFGPPRFVLD